MHCHSNHPAYCLVCNRQINYWDEMPSAFCSEICEREAEDNWGNCSICYAPTEKKEMTKLVSGELSCPRCYDQLQEGSEYDDADLT